MKHQNGFAAQAAVLIALAVALVVGGGYYVLSRQEKNPEPEVVQSSTATEIEVNGTPENAVNEVNQQLSEEIADEVGALGAEDNDTEIEEATLEALEGAVDESNI